MPAPFDPTDARVRVSTTSGGVYSVLGKARSFELTEGSESDVTLRWFGGDAARTGDDTLEASVSVWYDSADTTGQDVVRSAKRNGTAVWFQFCPEGAASGAQVLQFEAYISEMNVSADVDGDGVEASFTLRGTPSTLTEVTLA